MINVALFYGGRAGEHEISLRSAASVLANLDATKYTVIPVGMDKQGCFYLNDYHELLKYQDSLPVVTANSRYMPSILLDGRLTVVADVVFPVVHGPLYEDGCLQGLLKLSNVAFVGNDVLAASIGMDKDITRQISRFNNYDVHCAKYQVLSWHASKAMRDKFCREIVENFAWPVFFSSCSLGSSVGTNRATNANELKIAIQDALRYDESIIVEESIYGREIELAVLENIDPCGVPMVSLPGEIKVLAADGFYSYAVKYLTPNAAELCIPANLKPLMIARLQKLAAEIFINLKCKGMARIDFFVNEQTNMIYFNEINSL